VVMLVDRLFLRTPKLKGVISYVHVLPCVAPNERQPIISDSALSKAFDCEIFLRVSVVNYRPYVTTVSQWTLEVSKGRRHQEGVLFEPSAKNPIDVLRWVGIPDHPDVYIGSQKEKFEPNIEKRGWLAFRLQGIQSRELTDRCSLKLTAIDAQGRKHRIESRHHQKWN
jgi:hypothetical protein